MNRSPWIECFSFLPSTKRLTLWPLISFVSVASEWQVRQSSLVGLCSALAIPPQKSRERAMARVKTFAEGFTHRGDSLCAPTCCDSNHISPVNGSGGPSHEGLIDRWTGRLIGPRLLTSAETFGVCAEDVVDRIPVVMQVTTFCASTQGQYGRCWRYRLWARLLCLKPTRC